MFLRNSHFYVLGATLGLVFYEYISPRHYFSSNKLSTCESGLVFIPVSVRPHKTDTKKHTGSNGITVIHYTTDVVFNLHRLFFNRKLVLHTIQVLAVTLSALNILCP